MRKTIATILIVLGLALLVAGFSAHAFPQWISLPGGILLLITAAFIGVADLGGKLKNWREFLFGEDKEPARKQTPQQPSTEQPRRSQDMKRSEQGEQFMKGKGGVQEQKMSDSPGGKQHME